ncbi:MAG TPA: ATP-binding protein [Kofleriaceae bacterium]|nr:ATP-binding protein [Kofleriaceae bacterium]
MGLGTLVVLVITMAVTAIVMLSSTTEMSGEVARDYANGFSHAQTLSDLEERLVAAARGYLLSGDPALRIRFEASQNELAATIKDLDRHHLVPVARAYLVEVDTSASEYLREMDQAVERRSQMSDPKEIVPLFDQRLSPLRARVKSAVDSLSQAEHTTFDRALVDTRHRARVAGLAVVLVAILTIMCAIVLAVLVGRRLARDFHEVEDATAAAQRAARAREEVLAVVSHDLRTPLQAVVMSAELASECAGDGGTRRYLQTIRNASNRMQRMIEELVEAARLEQHGPELHAEPVDAAELIDMTGDLFRARAGSEGIELRLDAPHVHVLADRERVIEVLSNLIGNALKFTRRDGHVEVRAEPGANEVRFIVTDDGSGIPPDQLPHVFERGWQGSGGRANGGGLGLGLYICKTIIEAHRGTIGVTSELGHGARFWFTLPPAGRDPSARARPA